jgi:hypothetical protein
MSPDLVAAHPCPNEKCRPTRAVARQGLGDGLPKEKDLSRRDRGRRAGLGGGVSLSVASRSELPTALLHRRQLSKLPKPFCHRTQPRWRECSSVVVGPHASSHLKSSTRGDDPDHNVPVRQVTTTRNGVRSQFVQATDRPRTSGPSVLRDPNRNSHAISGQTNARVRGRLARGQCEEQRRS